MNALLLILTMLNATFTACACAAEEREISAAKSSDTESTAEERRASEEWLKISRMIDADQRAHFVVIQHKYRQLIEDEQKYEFERLFNKKYNEQREIDETELESIKKRCQEIKRPIETLVAELEARACALRERLFERTAERNKQGRRFIEQGLFIKDNPHPARYSGW